MKKLLLVIPFCLLVACNPDDDEEEEPKIEPIIIENIVTDIDGNSYDGVVIGTQTWMAENLKTTKYNDGTAIPLVTGSEVTSAPAYFWYDDTPSNGDTYGALYTWYALDAASNGGMNVCPANWHVPSDTEWTMMENYLIVNGFNYDGTTTDNKIAKSLASPSGWNLSSTEGAVGNTDYLTFRNKSGFTALPSGDRYGTLRQGGGAFFGDIGNFCYWWTSTEFNATDAWKRGMGYNDSFVFRYSISKFYAVSVRCLKD